MINNRDIEESSRAEESENIEDIEDILAKLLITNLPKKQESLAVVRRNIQSDQLCLVSTVNQKVTTTLINISKLQGKLLSIKKLDDPDFRKEYCFDRIDKNFYIPLESVKKYLQKTYNMTISDYYSAEYCVGELLKSIRNEFGEQFLNFNGLCVYLSTKEKELVCGFDIKNIDKEFAQPDLIIDDKEYYLNKSIDNRQQEISSINFDGEEFDEIIKQNKQNKNVEDDEKSSTSEYFGDDYIIYDEIKKTRKNKKLVNFSQKYLDTYRDGRMYFKDEIIIDNDRKKSKIYDGYKPMEYFCNLNSNNSKKTTYLQIKK